MAFEDMCVRRSRTYAHLIQSCLVWVILTLWQIQYTGAQETQQARPDIHIRTKRETTNYFDCFGDFGSLLNYNIKETDPPGTIVGIIPINGIAYGANATITLTLSGMPEIDKYLRIDTENKTLILTQMVDRDEPVGLTQLTSTLFCQQLPKDGVTIIPIPLPYSVQVDVGGVNDNTPKFLGLPYQVSISELTRVGTTVFKGFKAVDADGENRDGQIVYSIEPYAEDPMSSQWFSIRNSGRNEITLERELDYERKQEWLVLLQARDNGIPQNANLTVLTINVLDGNDLPPIYVPCNATNITVEDCTNLTYSTTIMERTVLPDPLEFWPGPVYAVDADENVTNAEPIYYTLYEGTPDNYAEYFAINSSSGDVRLLKPVCYNDIQRFDIEVKASEGPLPTQHNSSAFLAIGVMEKNEYTPEFNETEYIGYVYENSPEGTQIKASPNSQEPLRIAAVDQDIDPACGTALMYSLHDSSGSFILMEQEIASAYVVTNRELDRETRQNYTLDVVAIEINTEDRKESTPTKVTVVILDRNDNAPQFMRNQYSTEANRYKVDVRENHPLDAAVIALVAVDADSPTSDYIHISFEYVTNPNSGRPFRMQRITNTSVAIMLEPGVYLERGESHVVSLQATDALDETLKSSVIYVELEVLRNNDTHAPRFSQTTYTATASEGLPIGAFVTTVTATDPDEDEVTYSLDAGNEDDTFHIEASSGDITIKKELDRETTPTYLLNVTAFDGNLSTTTYLMITVLDINDNNPEFNTSWPTTFLVLEGMTEEFVGQVMAYDKDQEDTKNSQIMYSINSDYFKIDALNGSIYTKLALDREQQERYELSVAAIDSAAAARSSNLLVTVIVQDVNDNGPVFEKTEYSVELKEEHMTQDFLTLQALDVDENAVLEYGITAGDTNIFTIDRKTGKMSLLQPLDYEMAQTHKVNVTVTDVEINKMEDNSTATVAITVLDINDHRPEFTKQEYQGAVLRTADLSTVVVNDILAIDGDMPTSLNGQVQYRINPPNEWFIMPDLNEGIVVTKSSLQNVPEFFNLTVVAFDRGTPTLGARAHVIIDIRVEKPIFPDPVLRVNSLMEGQPIGSHVVDVEAVANRGDEITYSIINDEQDLFRIESKANVGKIYTTQILDRESISTYTIDVQAILNNGTNNVVDGNQRRRKRATDTNVIEVIIELGDINDNPPEFLQDKYFIGVSQNAGIATTVIKMQAIDSDSGNNSAIRYSLEPSPTGSSDEDPLDLFTIDSDSGIISTTTKALPMTAKATAYEIGVLGMEKFSDKFDPASTIVSIAIINNLYRAVLVGTVPPDLTENNINSVRTTLEQLLDALVFVDDVSTLKYGEDLSLVDPSGSDTTFYAINTTSGLPLETEKIISNLKDNKKELDALYSSIVSNGTWIETRPVGVGKSQQVNNSEPTIEAIALICLAIVLFVACVIAILVIIISWKKTTKMKKRREMEREKQARVYLPMYSGFNPYANNNEEMEIANPVYFDDQSVQVNDELFPNGAPTFLREAEVQNLSTFKSCMLQQKKSSTKTVEATMEFAPEESDEEANAVANSIAAACVGSDRSSIKDLKDMYPPSSGPPSYTSQENTPLPNLVYDADSLPRKVPPQPDRPPPLPPAPSEPPPPPPSKPPAYDNQAVDIADERPNHQDLPTTQPRTDSLPRDDKNYSPSQESSYRNGRGSVEPKDLDDDPNNVHLVKIYRPPSRFDDTPPSTTDSSSREHKSPNGGIGNHSNQGNHIGEGGTRPNDRSKRLPNGKAAWEPEEVLTTAL
ncbi:protocadherin-15-like isoform X3 [Amphiura filiformis]|uniref:protocadherin-15-like isoform X3 n=1 Tax=Amphiura filiformis TaxID=82378 RepID=UPI003B222A4B